MKSRILVALMLTGLLTVLGGMLLTGPWVHLQERLQEAALRTEAQAVIQARSLDLSNLNWTPDRTQYVPPAESRRDELADAYKKALLELSYALFTGDTSGLTTYFAQAALDDAIRAAASGNQQRFVTWNHRLALHFYAPQGNIAAFADSYCYAQWAAATLRPMSGRRSVDVVMRLGEDGQWRVHQWRVTLDVALALRRGLDNPESARLWPCRS
ncbi:hypothetical protein GCM10008955_36980 [Deinococcus malanensis]|uniref:SnoaL-like domain-containing protein n=1 Tax=Deinococcus malanensis TaxID=1706855 RepID=A0ABQ2F1E2_9DEIO|nr:hypothetical protein [Deinococcus malanensis]GGK39751.1 hypothetical protein GCM10008955_36980 [Deinococcus malanensis]